MKAPQLKPDLTEATRFLNYLEPGGEFWFQTATEPKAKDARGSARVLSGTLDKCGATLSQLNQSGSAVWVQINAGSGRKDTDVNRIRAYFVDLDHVPGDALFASPVPADIIVESSPGKFHGYWLTSGAPLDSYVIRLHALADKFGGDHNVCNLGRVMRLPGFYHLKNSPFMARIVKIREGL
jgi:hypothetical protein